MSENASNYARNLQARLAAAIPAEGVNLQEKVRACGDGGLPDELATLLKSIVEDPVLASSEYGATPENWMSFAFRCGQAHEMLGTLARGKADNIVFVRPDGTSIEALENIDIDTLAKFAALRDRILKTVADYTLKFLLVSAVLTIIGLSLGLI